MGYLSGTEPIGGESPWLGCYPTPWELAGALVQHMGPLAGSKKLCAEVLFPSCLEGYAKITLDPTTPENKDVERKVRLVLTGAVTLGVQHRPRSVGEHSSRKEPIERQCTVSAYGFPGCTEWASSMQACIEDSMTQAASDDRIRAAFKALQDRLELEGVEQKNSTPLPSRLP